MHTGDLVTMNDDPSVRSTIPVPPTDLHKRVAGPLSDEDNYERNGLRAREDIVALLPGDWEWEGKRLSVLTTVCGASGERRQPPG